MPIHTFPQPWRTIFDDAHFFHMAIFGQKIYLTNIGLLFNTSATALVMGWEK